MQNSLSDGRGEIRVGDNHVLEHFIGPTIRLLLLHHSSSELRKNPVHGLDGYVPSGRKQQRHLLCVLLEL